MIVSLIKINEQMKTILRENQRQDQLIQISIITNSRNLTSHRKSPLEPTLVYNNLSVFPVAKVCLLDAVMIGHLNDVTLCIYIAAYNRL